MECVNRIAQFWLWLCEAMMNFVEILCMTFFDCHFENMGNTEMINMCECVFTEWFLGVFSQLVLCWFLWFRSVSISTANIFIYFR